MTLTGPTTIHAPGTYTFANDITAPDVNGLVVLASDVIIDLNGFTLSSAPGVAQTIGVSIAQYAHRVQVTGGLITGFTFGVHNNGSTSTFLVDLDLSRNLYVGANLGGGWASTVRRVTCRQIGGYSAEAYAVAINGIGSEGVVEDSIFEDLYRQSGVSGVGEGVAVLVGAGEANVKVRRNQMRNSRVEPNTIGVFGAEGATGLISDNLFHNLSAAIMANPNLIQSGNVSTSDGGSPAPIPEQIFATMLVGSQRYEGYLPRVP